MVAQDSAWVELKQVDQPAATPEHRAQVLLAAK